MLQVHDHVGKSGIWKESGYLIVVPRFSFLDFGRESYCTAQCCSLQNIGTHHRFKPGTVSQSVSHYHTPTNGAHGPYTL
jgi:hypothetical protein